MPCNYQPEFGRLIPLRCLLALNTLDFELSVAGLEALYAVAPTALYMHMHLQL